MKELIYCFKRNENKDNYKLLIQSIFENHSDIFGLSVAL